MASAGAILTKMDGDSRGGAALSVKEVSGRPIKFVGSGEKLEALELFYPDRIASRILGMGARFLHPSNSADVVPASYTSGPKACRPTAGAIQQTAHGQTLQSRWQCCGDEHRTPREPAALYTKSVRVCQNITAHTCAPGAGDILSLVEKAEQSIKGADAERMAERMLANKFDFNDFMDQSRMMGQMGSMGQMMKMIPGAQRTRACPLLRSCCGHRHRPAANIVLAQQQQTQQWTPSKA